jgi:hypothetical protein
MVKTAKGNKNEILQVGGSAGIKVEIRYSRIKLTSSFIF